MLNNTIIKQLRERSMSVSHFSLPAPTTSSLLTQPALLSQPSSTQSGSSQALVCSGHFPVSTACPRGQFVKSTLKNERGSLAPHRLGRLDRHRLRPHHLHQDVHPVPSSWQATCHLRHTGGRGGTIV